MWWKPGGDFYTVLAHEASTLGHAVVPFCWSGLPLESEMINASHVLASLLITYIGKEQIILVGHSHGGNVVNYATGVLGEYVQSKPLLKPQISAITLNKPQSPKPILSKPGLDINPTLRIEHDLAVSPIIYPIHKIYVLGTPVYTTKFIPNMGIVGAFINLYSAGDLVQAVGGIFNRKYKSCQRLTNLEVMMQKDSKAVQRPSHNQMHDAIIGRWILHIPESLQEKRLGNFDQFSYGIDAQVLFYESNHPAYCKPLT